MSCYELFDTPTGCESTYSPPQDCEELNRFDLYPYEMTWEEARDTCCKMGKRLAVINTWEEHAMMREQTQKGVGRVLDFAGNLMRKIAWRRLCR